MSVLCRLRFPPASGIGWLRLPEERRWRRCVLRPAAEVCWRKVYDRVQWVLGVSLLNLFPLPREAGFRESFAFAGESVDRGYSILVFPEGHHTTDGKIAPLSRRRRTAGEQPGDTGRPHADRRTLRVEKGEEEICAAGKDTGENRRPGTIFRGTVLQSGLPPSCRRRWKTCRSELCRLFIDLVTVRQTCRMRSASECERVIFLQAVEKESAWAGVVSPAQSVTNKNLSGGRKTCISI